MSEESKKRGFIHFLMRGNVVDLAVGIVIGASFNSVVNGLVKDFITPILAHALALIATHGFNPNTFAQASWSGFMIGDFISNVISFLITATVLYFFIVGPLEAIQDHIMKKKRDEAKSERDCPFCFNTISDQATRCGYCTSLLPPKDQPPAYLNPLQPPFSNLPMR